VRLFVGLIPTPEATTHAAGAVDRIASTTPDMRWVPSERWHVTLAFLGEVDPDRLPVLTAHLDELAARQEPLAGLRLEDAGTFRGVLWLGVTDPAGALWSKSATGRPFPTEERLGALARAVQRAMRDAHVPVERRPWRAHLTIARWRPSPERDAAARRAAEALADYSGPDFDVREIRLVHSITGPSPHYEDLHVVGLTGNKGQGAGKT
jgi:2'-5' RNA ligase